MEDIKLEESLDFVDAIDFANNLCPYEEASALGNLVKGAVTSAGKNIGHAIKKGVDGAVNTARAGIQNAANNIQQKQASKDLDNKLENLANALSAIMTQSAAGDDKEVVDDAQKTADKTNAKADKAQAKADKTQQKIEDQMKNAATASDSDSSIAGGE